MSVENKLMSLGYEIKKTNKEWYLQTHVNII
jgi:hypothetical protein